MSKTATVSIVGLDIVLSAGDRVGPLPGGNIVIADPAGKPLCAITPAGALDEYAPFRAEPAAKAWLSACAALYAAQLAGQAQAARNTAGPVVAADVTPGVPTPPAGPPPGPVVVADVTPGVPTPPAAELAQGDTDAPPAADTQPSADEPVKRSDDLEP